MGNMRPVKNFGFKNFRGKAFEIEIKQPFKGVVAGSIGHASARNFAVAVFNKHGKRAETIAKEPGHTPVKTGAMRNSIKWINAKRTGFTGVIEGSLSVGGLGIPKDAGGVKDVLYGQIQENFNPHLPFFLQRAIEQVTPGVLRDLNNKGSWESIMLGKSFFPGSF